MTWPAAARCAPGRSRHGGSVQPTINGLRPSTAWRFHVEIIVEAQIPVYPPGDDAALIYDRRRRHEQIRQLTGIEAALMRGTKKAFFIGRWPRARGWTLVGLAQDQDW